MDKSVHKKENDVFLCQPITNRLLLLVFMRLVTVANSELAMAYPGERHW
jgi:hypothetical protein